MGSSSKSVQKLDVFVQEERAAENGNNSDAKIPTNIVPEKEKDEYAKPNVYMITDAQLPDGDVSRHHENPPQDLDAKKIVVRNLLRDIAEQNQKTHIKNESIQHRELPTSGMLAQNRTDEAGSVENADEYKHRLEDEVTQGALLAMTLQSILNDQSFETNENRDLMQQSDSDPNNFKSSDCGRMQHCKSVQTMECNSIAPANEVHSPFPLFPAYHLPDGNTHPIPPLFYIPCTSGNFPCTTTEQVKSLASTSDPHRKNNMSWKRTPKDFNCSRYVSVRQQESSSSLSTPSSPASIHEIDDLCETGWNHANEPLAAVSSSPTDVNHNDLEKKSREEEATEKCTGNRSDATMESSRREPAVPGLPCLQGGRFGMSGEEELHIDTRLPSSDHTRPRVQSWVKEAVSTLEIPSMALASRKSYTASYKGVIVPSWAEIKRPMRESSSSQSSSTSTDGVSSYSTNSSFSIGELQQKAFAILRDSVSTSRVSLGEQDNVAPGLLEGNSEGEVVNTVFRGDDTVELGEVMVERLPLQVGDSASSEGALHSELGEIVF